MTASQCWLEFASKVLKSRSGLGPPTSCVWLGRPRGQILGLSTRLCFLLTCNVGQSLTSLSLWSLDYKVGMVITSPLLVLL